MATTRFDRFLPRDYRLSVPNIQTFIPNFNLWDKTLSQQQQMYDNTLLFSEKVPDHLQQDSEAVNMYMKGIQDNIDNLTTAYKDSGVSIGNRERSKFMRQLRRDWQPGGIADTVQKRKQQYINTAKGIDEFYKDDPMVADFMKSQIQVSSLDDAIANNTLGVNSPSTPSLISNKDFQTHVNSVLDNISADQIVSPIHRSKVKGMSFKQLQSRGLTKYIDKDKAAIALIGSMTPEMQQSFELRGLARGVQGQGNILNPTDDGSIEFDNASALGRYLNAAVTGKSFEEKSVKDTVITDTFGQQRELAKYKKSLEDKPFEGFDRTRAVNIKSFDNGALEKSGIKVTDDNRIILKGKSEKKVRPGEGGGSTWNGSFFRTQIELNNTEELKMNSPELAPLVSWAEARGVFDNIKVDTKGKTQKQIQEEIDRTKVAIIAKEFKNIEENYTAGVQFSAFTPKAKKEFNEILFNRAENKSGKQYTAGLIGDRVMKNLKTGQIVSDEDISELENELGGMASGQGMVDAAQSYAPYGSTIVNIGNEQFIVEPRLSDQVKPENYANALYISKNGTRGLPHERSFPDGVVIPGTNQMLPSGDYKFTYWPNEDEAGNITGYHTVEKKQGNKWVKIFEHEDFNDITLNSKLTVINPNKDGK